MNITKQIGQRLRQAREQRGLTQDAVALAAGYANGSFISEIEGGKRQAYIGTLVRLCEVLGLSLAELISGERVERRVKSEIEELYHE